jgi:hypothetical protein
MPLEDNTKIVPLDAAQLAAAQAALAAAATAVEPLLRHLSPESINRLTKYGDKSSAFVSEANDAVLAVGDALPSAFNAQHFHDYVLVMQQIELLLGPVGTLWDGLVNSKMLVGSFLMQNANFVYAQLKAVQNLDPRVVPYVEEMRKRYASVSPSGPKKSKVATL